MKKIYWIPASFLMASSVFSFSLIASADHDHEDREHREYYDQQEYESDGHGHEYYDDEDDDYEDDEYEENEESNYYEQQPSAKVSKEVWYKWSRSAAEPVESAVLPINQATEISIKINNEEPVKIDAIPVGSQLLVPVEEAAIYLGASTTLYPNSEIIEINKENMNLIVRSNSRVVYENMRKTPMQAAITKKNETYYIPISVLANGLGFQINENFTNNQIKLERVVQL